MQLCLFVEAFAFGDAVTIQVRLPTLKEDSTLEATVRWKVGDGYGVQFGSLHALGLAAFDVEELPTHGGSLRIWVCHDNARPATPAVEKMRQQEAAAEAERAVAAPDAEKMKAALDILTEAKTAISRLAMTGRPGREHHAAIMARLTDLTACADVVVRLEGSK